MDILGFIFCVCLKFSIKKVKKEIGPKKTHKNPVGR